MATDLEVGQNRTNLQSIADAVDATTASQAAKVKGRDTGAAGTATKTGDAAWTTIVWAHNLPYTPSKVIISPTTAAAGLPAAGAYVSAKSATTFTITFAAAPANAAVCTFDYVAYA